MLVSKQFSGDSPNRSGLGLDRSWLALKAWILLRAYGHADGGARSVDPRDARRNVFVCIELLYNPKRKHTNIGILSPFDCEIRQLCRDKGAKMTRRPRRNHSPAFKAKVALAALKGDRTMSGFATQFDLHPNQIKQRKDQLLDGVSDVFYEKPRSSKAPRSTSNPCMRRLAN